MKKSALLLALLIFVSLPIFAQSVIFKGNPVKEKHPELNDQFLKYFIYQIQTPDLESYVGSKDGESHFNLHLGDEFEWSINLEPHDIRTPDYTLREATPKGVRILPKGKNISYRGHLENAGPSMVSLCIDHYFLYGFVKKTNEEFFIEPLSYFIPDAPEDQYLVYKMSDVLPGPIAKCGVTEMNEHHPSHPIQKSPNTGQCYKVQLAIASDYSMFTKYGNSANTQNHNIGVINNVQNNYLGDFADDIQFQIVTQFVSTCSTCDPWTSSTSASNLLDDFTGWGNTNGFGTGVVFDDGELWSNRDYDGATVGLAWLSSLCTQYKYHVLQDFTSDAQYLRCMAAHEIGHNFNAVHDANSGFIMSPFVSNANTWSALSVTDINSFISDVAAQGGCFSACTGGSAPIANFTADVTSGCTPLSVHFTDQSTNTPTTWSWTFTGGTPSTSSSQNPTVTYSTAGTYSVTLVASNTYGSNTITKTNYITVSPSPVANFSYSINGGSVTFTNTSTNGNSYAWSFGDGGTSTNTSPSHLYTNSGTYTVSLTATNDCGSNTKTVTITITLPPTAGFNAQPTSGCTPLSVHFIDESLNVPSSWAWQFPGGTPSSSTQQNPTIVYNTPGNYNVTLVATNGAGSNSYTEFNYIHVSAAPVAGFTVNTVGTTANFTNTSSNANSYSWSFGDSQTSTQTSPSHTYAANGTYTVTLTATSSCGSNTSTQTVTIVTPPTANFSADLNSGCVPLTVHFINNSSTNATSWNWSFPGGTPSSSTAQNPVVVYQNPGTFNVTLVATNAAGSDSITRSSYITVYPKPDAGFSYNVTGAQVVFSNTSANADSFNWNFGDSNTSSQISPTHNYASDGVYSVRLIATNACGNDTSYQNITIVTVPNANFSANATSGCAPLTVQFNNQSSANAVSLLWQFPGGNPSSSTALNPSVVYGNAGTYSVTLIATNSAGSDTSVFVNYIQVGTVPGSSFSTIIIGAQVNFTNTSQNASSYSWNFGDGNTSTATNPTNTYLLNGTYTVTLTATNSCGSSTSTQTVTIVTPPDAGFSASTTTGCAPLSVQFNNQSSPNGLTYHWLFPGGSPSSSTNANPVIVYSAAGTYSVTLIASNAAGNDTLMRASYVHVSGVPDAGFSVSANGTSASFSNTTLNGSSFIWNFGDSGTSTESGPTHTYAADGTYTVMLIATNSCGNDTLTQSVIISTTPIAGFSQDIQTGCAPLSIHFNNQSSANVTNVQWLFPGGNPSSSTSNNPVVVYSTPGTYNVTLIASNAAGNDTLVRTSYIHVNGAPDAGFSVGVNGSTASFTNTGSNGSTYTWNFGDSGTSTESGPSHTYAADGAYTVTLISSNSCGNDTTTQLVVITTPPTAGFTPSVQNGCAPLTVQFSNQSSSNVSGYHWFFPGGTPSTSFAPNPEVVYNEAGVFEVTLIVSNGAGSDTLIMPGLIHTYQVPTYSNLTEVCNSNNSAFTVSFNIATGTPPFTVVYTGTNTTAGSINGNHFESLPIAPGEYSFTIQDVHSCGPIEINGNHLCSCTSAAGTMSATPLSACAGSTVTGTYQQDGVLDGNDTEEFILHTNSTGSTGTILQRNASGAFGFAAPMEYEVTYYISHVVGNNNGEQQVDLNDPCLGISIGQPVIFHQEPVANAGLDNSVCGNTITLGAMADVGIGHWTQLSGPGTAIFTDAQNANSEVSVNESGTYTFRWSENNFGCIDGDKVDIEFKQIPVAQPTNNSPLCEGQFLLLGANSSPDATYHWSGPGGYSSEVQNPIDATEPGIYELYITSSEGCNSTIETTNVVINPVPIPSFSVTINGSDVSFTNTSADATSFVWNFGDNSTSFDANPSHTYGNDGVYNVTLTAINNCGAITTTQGVNILTDPTAGFTADIVSGCAPLTVNFSDFSSNNTTSWQWTFQGGDPETSDQENPVVVYTVPGSYDVTLVATNGAGSSTFSQTQYIVVSAGTQSEAIITSQSGSQTIQCENTSTGATSYLWNFGDNTTSTETSPSHTYSHDGQFIVTLTSINACGSSTSTFEVEIVTVPQAGFSSDIQQGCAPLTVQFEDQSSDNVSSWSWTFEGGQPSTSTDQHPTIIYEAPGVYPVSLEVSNAAFSNSITQTSWITVGTVPQASFSALNNQGGIVITNNTSSNANSYFWTFGDNETSTEVSPTHTYTANGFYTITLIAMNDCGSDTSAIEVQVHLVGTNNPEPLEEINLYPNPNDGHFTLEINGSISGKLSFRMMDVLGQILLSDETEVLTSSFTKVFDLRHFAAGTYILECKNGSKVVYKKVVIE